MFINNGHRIGFLIKILIDKRELLTEISILHKKLDNTVNGFSSLTRSTFVKGQTLPDIARPCLMSQTRVLEFQNVNFLWLRSCDTSLGWLIVIATWKPPNCGASSGGPLHTAWLMMTISNVYAEVACSLDDPVAHTVNAVNLQAA